MKPKARGPYAPRKPNLRSSQAPRPRSGNLATLAALKAEVQQIKAHMLELEDDKDALMDAMERMRADNDRHKQAVLALTRQNDRLTEERDELARVFQTYLTNAEAEIARLRAALKVAHDNLAAVACDGSIVGVAQAHARAALAPAEPKP